jgi:tRNA A-37 threonylcarbamoyl transferase component Bud32
VRYAIAAVAHENATADVVRGYDPAVSSVISAVEPVGLAASSFQILARIAKGGMAEIFLARAATAAGVARHVVLKRVSRDRAHDTQFLRMFLDEARLAAQLQHPNIAQVYDVGKLGDSYFFTMEYVHGESVRAIMHALAARDAAMPVMCALTVAAGAAAGLHHAHERIGVDGRPLGIVHRDVSPSNLMVGFEGTVKVVDFGVAQAAQRDHDTVSGTVKGKISYLSPEQATGAPIDRRSDVFSLGIVLWEMLTGRRLYQRPSDFSSMSAIVSEPTTPPSVIRPEVPAAVDAIVLRALAKHPDDRFASAHEMFETIEAAAATIAQPVSVAGLARFVRDIFGPRPEPWIALERPAGYSSVTLTAEPIPEDLVVADAGPVERQLASVVDLSAMTDPVTARRVADVTDATASAPRRRSWRWPAIGVAAAIVFGIALAVVLPSSSPRQHGDVASTPAPGEASRVAVDTSRAAHAVAPRDPPTAYTDPPTERPAPTAAHTDSPTSRTDRPTDDADSPTEHAPTTPAAPVHAAATPRAATDKELVDRCANGLATKQPATCVLAACRLHDATRAEAWFGNVAATARKSTAAQCRVSHIEVERKDVERKDAECEADPSRCQF